MKLAIFGATGGTGRQLVEQALADGHQVTAFVRRPVALKVRHDRIRIVAGDVRDAAQVESAIERQDAVLSAL
jgi:putative NADH-flavin reductase